MCVRYRVFGAVSPYVVCENGRGYVLSFLAR